MGGRSVLEEQSLLDERGQPSRRWAELGVVRASELAGRESTRFPGAHRPGARRPVDRRPLAPDPEVPEPAAPPGPAVPAASSSPEDAAVLPVVPALAGLLPGGGLRRGSAVVVTGSTALVLAVLAEASRAGSWCALVGLPALGVQAAAEAGLDLARTALVPRPGPRSTAVVAALADGVDVVVLGDAARWSAGDRQRLAARVRQRGAVLVPVGPPGVWPGAEVELYAVGGVWSGVGAEGVGRLRSRRVRVRCTARGRPGWSGADLLLPGPSGGCVSGDEAGPGGVVREGDAVPARVRVAVAG